MYIKSRITPLRLILISKILSAKGEKHNEEDQINKLYKKLLIKIKTINSQKKLIYLLY